GARRRRAGVRARDADRGDGPLGPLVQLPQARGRRHGRRSDPAHRAGSSRHPQLRAEVDRRGEGEAASDGPRPARELSIAMPKPKKGPRLGSGPAHQKLMLSGLASSLIRDGKIRTTEARAKAVRPVIEKLITKAKKGDLASRRLVLRTIPNREIVHKLFADVAPQ